MYRLLATIILVLPVSACGSAWGVRWDTWRHRETVQVTYCSGSDYAWDFCYRQARDLCGTRTYVIISLTGDNGVTVSGKNRHRVAKSRTHRSMKFSCR